VLELVLARGGRSRHRGLARRHGQSEDRRNGRRPHPTTHPCHHRFTPAPPQPHQDNRAILTRTASSWGPLTSSPLPSHKSHSFDSAPPSIVPYRAQLGQPTRRPGCGAPRSGECGPLTAHGHRGGRAGGRQVPSRPAPEPPAPTSSDGGTPP